MGFGRRGGRGGRGGRTSPRPAPGAAGPVAMLALTLPLAACSSGPASASGSARPQPHFTGFSPVPAVPAPTLSVYVPHACPSPSGSVTRPVWPASLPANLPRPADATLQSTKVSSSGIAITQFETPEALGASVTTVLEALKRAHYVLGRGDAEVAEADVPFADATLRGTIRLVGTGACTTVWIVATTSGGTGDPYLLPRHTTASPSSTTVGLPPFGSTP